MKYFPHSYNHKVQKQWAAEGHLINNKLWNQKQLISLYLEEWEVDINKSKSQRLVGVAEYQLVEEAHGIVSEINQKNYTSFLYLRLIVLNKYLIYQILATKPV